MSKRGVIYVYWGSKIRAELQRSIDSVRQWHPELPIYEYELQPDATLLDKARMFWASPFETTLFLDTDTIVLDRLDFGFEKAERHGLACCICECPWARRFGDLTGDIVEYNTGVLFFNRTVEAFFKRWDELNHSIDSSVLFRMGMKIRQMPHNDQAGFALAAEELGFSPFVLPLNWNLRPAWQRAFFGPLKIWHDRGDPPPMIHMWNEEQRLDHAVVNYLNGFAAPAATT